MGHLRTMKGLWTLPQVNQGERKTQSAYNQLPCFAYVLPLTYPLHAVRRLLDVTKTGLPNESFGFENSSV